MPHTSGDPPHCQQLSPPQRVSATMLYSRTSAFVTLRRVERAVVEHCKLGAASERLADPRSELFTCIKRGWAVCRLGRSPHQLAEGGVTGSGRVNGHCVSVHSLPAMPSAARQRRHKTDRTDGVRVTVRRQTRRATDRGGWHRGHQTKSTTGAAEGHCRQEHHETCEPELEDTLW